jgi:RecA/RadA recombinase
MSSRSDKVVALRRLLDERHPTSRPREHQNIPTGVPELDAILGGGIQTGTLTEFVSTGASTGSQTALGCLLAQTRLARQRLAIVDAAGAFDIEGFDDDLVAHVVWIRCQSLSECWRTADLVARDPNYAATIVDVRGLPLRELLRTRDSIWVRLQRAVEQAETALLVQSHSAVVPNAACRIEFSEPLSPETLIAPRHAIAARIAPSVQRRRTRQLEITA